MKRTFDAKSLHTNTEPLGNRSGTDLWATGSGVVGAFRPHRQPSHDGELANHVPPTLPDEPAELARHVGFRSPRSVGIELWLKWRHGEIDRVTIAAPTFVAIGYGEPGDWCITSVKARP